MNPVNSRDIIANHIRDIQAQAIAAGRHTRNSRRPHSAWRSLAALAAPVSRRTRTA